MGDESLESSVSEMDLSVPSVDLSLNDLATEQVVDEYKKKVQSPTLFSFLT